MLIKIGKVTLSIILCLLFASIALADLIVNARLSQAEITIDQRVNLIITLEGSDAKNIRLPQLPKLNDLSVLNTSQSSSYSWVNGKASATKRFTYTLLPLNEGTIKIPSMQLSVRGKNYKTNSLTLKVLPGGSKIKGQTNLPKSAPAMFVVASVDKKNVYVGEQLIYTMKFYRRVQLFGNVSYSPPDFKGFVTSQIDQQSISSSEMVNNREYHVDTIRTILVPTYKADKLVIDPVAIVAQMGFFEPARTIKSQPINIKVNSLPDYNRKTIFSGVGEYSLEVSFDKKSVPVGEVVNAVITVSGEGNIKDLLLPEIKLPEDIKQFDSKEKVDVEVKGNKLRGIKKAELILIPGIAGEYNFEPIVFTYFSAKQKKYVTKRINVPSIKVTKGKAPVIHSVSGDDSLVTQKELIFRNQDIHYIKDELGSLSEVLTYKSRSFLYSLFGLSCLLVVNIIYFVVKHLKNKNADILRSKTSIRNGIKRIKKAKKLIKDNNVQGFYEMISDSLMLLFADQFGVSSKGLTKTSITQLCKQKEIPDEIVDEVFNVIDTCNMSRFAPKGSEQEDMNSLYVKCENLIKGLGKFF